MIPAIGIDLGTTNSCVAVFKDDRVTIIPNDNGNLTTPSYVAFGDKGRLIGDEAKNQAAMNAENTIFDVKRLIGRRFLDPIVQSDMKKWPFKVIDDDTRPLIKVTDRGKGKTFFLEEVSSMILVKMKQIAEKYLQESVKDAVITVPAYFNDSQKQATMDAGRIAGLNVLKLINEPTSAAIAYCLNNAKLEEQNILIYDLGGGTFDVSLLGIKGKKMSVKSIGGNTHLGGEDFDNNLMEYLANDFKKTNHKDISMDYRVLRRLRNACERAKKQLSVLNETNIEIDSICVGCDLNVMVSRKKFEELNDELFKSTLEIVKDCLEQAGLRKTEIAEVILVGGSTRIPKIREILQEFFDGKKLNHTLNPDEAVAYGAAVQAAILQGDRSKAIEEVSYSDVTPLSLGLKLASGRMSILIKRNTKIPTQKVDNFYNNRIGQTLTSFPVYEGEIISEAKRNHLLGEFTLTGYTPRVNSQNEFDVTFHIDENGLLKASALEKDSNIQKSIKITLDRGRLTKEEIDRIVREGETFKNEEDQHKGIADAINKLMRYCTDTKSKLKNLNISYSIKSLILNRCNEVLEWIDENDSETREVYLKKKIETEKYCQNLLR